MKNILIIGLGKSGLGSARLLATKANISVYDAKSESDINAEIKEELKTLGINTFFGVDPIGDFDELVLSPAVPLNNPIVKKYQEAGAEIIGELELAYRYCKGTFLGITGTNGKTTTTSLVGEIIKGAGKDCSVVGNIGNAVSEVAEMADENTVMVTEISSFQLETIKEFHPHISAILNLSPDHLDRHGSYEGYIAAKANILKNQTMDDYFVYNIEDPDTKKLADSVNHVNKIPFSSNEEADLENKFDNCAFVKENNICVRKDKKTYVLCKTEELQIPGKHNVENALAAAAIGVFAGVKSRSVGKSLKAFKSVEHRLEFVRELKGVKYYNDSKGTNPDSSIKALQAMKAPIILIAGGYDKKLDFDDFIEAFDNKVEYLLLIGATARQIEETAINHGFSDDRIIKLDSLEACVASAAKLAERGYTVLLSPACASWGMFNNYEERGRIFKELVRAL